MARRRKLYYYYQFYYYEKRYPLTRANGCFFSSALVIYKMPARNKTPVHKLIHDDQCIGAKKNERHFSITEA